MVRAWEQLRAAGLLSYGVELGDRLHPIAQARYQDLLDAGEINALPTTYEAAMRILVTDQNGDSQFDINIDSLMRARVVREGATREQVRAALLADPVPVGADRIERESSGVSRFPFGGGLNDAGRALHRDVGDVRLRDAAIDAARDFMRENRGALHHNAGLLASNALTSAGALAEEGRADAGARLLFETGAQLIRAGKHAQARRLIDALDGEPYRRATFNGMGFPVGAGSEAVRRSGPGGRVRVDIDPDDHDLMGVSAARLQRAQLDWIDGLRAVVGADADPYVLEDVREYLAVVARDGDVDDLARCMREYAEAFYVHAGSDVRYEGWPDENTRPAGAQSIMDSTLSTVDGRRLIDCEGFTYLASHLTSDIQGRDGGNRFDQWFVSTESHITLLLYDREHPGEAIYVDNDGIGARHSVNDELLVADLVHQVMGEVNVGGRVRAVALNEQPGGAWPYDEDGEPRMGEGHITVVGHGRVELDPRVLGAGEWKYRFMQVDGVVHDRFREFWEGRERPENNDAAMQEFVEAHREFLGPELSHSDFVSMRRLAREER